MKAKVYMEYNGEHYKWKAGDCEGTHCSKCAINHLCAPDNDVHCLNCLWCGNECGHWVKDRKKREVKKCEK